MCFVSVFVVVESDQLALELLDLLVKESAAARLVCELH